MAVKAQTKNNTWWIVLVIVLLLGAGYGGYRYWKSKQQPTTLAKGSDKTTQETETETTENEPTKETNTQSSGFSATTAGQIKKIAALDILGKVKFDAFTVQTWNSYAKLSAGAVYEKGDKYAAVACIQKILTINKFYTGKIDGIWGSGTDAAVAKCINSLNGKNNKKYSIKMLEYTGESAFDDGFTAIMTWYAM